MKKIILGAAIFGLGSMAFAQQQDQKVKPEITKMGIKNKKIHPIENMQVELKLTDAQMQQVKALREKDQPYQEEMKKLRDQQQKLRVAHHQQGKAEMKKILTPEQFSVWESKRKQKFNSDGKSRMEKRKAVKTTV